MERPDTLAEVARRTHEGVQPYGHALSEFLDNFYWAIKNERDVSAMIQEEPVLLEDQLKNAFLAAVAEHLVLRWDCPPIPAWVDGESRFSREPYYASPAEELRPLLKKQSPFAFYRRNIFTEAEPLRRASMPRPM